MTKQLTSESIAVISIKVPLDVLHVSATFSAVEMWEFWCQRCPWTENVLKFSSLENWPTANSAKMSPFYLTNFHYYHQPDPKYHPPQKTINSSCCSYNSHHPPPQKNLLQIVILSLTAAPSTFPRRHRYRGAGRGAQRRAVTVASTVAVALRQRYRPPVV